MSFNEKYLTNFVKASASGNTQSISSKRNLTGEEAKNIYIEEVRDIKRSISISEDETDFGSYRQKELLKRKFKDPVSDKHLFVAVQNNDVETVKCTLEVQPQKVNIRDEYGWSLLMIACRANLLEMVKVLLNFGADVSVIDRAGNTAHRLVTQNQNDQIIDLLLNKNKTAVSSTKEFKKTKSIAKKEYYMCDICNSTYSNKIRHFSSTVHNLNSSKGMKMPNCYKIPESNKGFQIMLKDGWNKDSGLGVEGDGIKYPLKAIEKRDRKGLGHKIVKNKAEISEKQKLKQNVVKDYKRSKNMEINFRREFY